MNASFIALISWGTASFWPIGLALAIIYSALLFVGAICLRRRASAKQLALVIDVRPRPSNIVSIVPPLTVMNGARRSFSFLALLAWPRVAQF